MCSMSQSLILSREKLRHSAKDLPVVAGQEVLHGHLARHRFFWSNEWCYLYQIISVFRRWVAIRTAKPSYDSGESQVGGAGRRPHCVQTMAWRSEPSKNRDILVQTSTIACPKRPVRLRSPNSIPCAGHGTAAPELSRGESSLLHHTARGNGFELTPSRTRNIAELWIPWCMPDPTMPRAHNYAFGGFCVAKAQVRAFPNVSPHNVLGNEVREDVAPMPSPAFPTALGRLCLNCNDWIEPLV